jgi:outer membrane protein TolC
VLINQVRDDHPGSLLFPLPGLGGEEGILITRLTYDRSKDDLSRRVQDLLFSVEQAYWTLYSSYWDLYSTEIALQQAYSALQQARKGFEKGQVTVQDLAAVEQQYQAFRLQRLESLGGPGQSVLEAERNLRFVVGLPPEDGTRLIPLDRPTTAPYRPDWQAAVMEALVVRPELMETRRTIQALNLDILRTKDLARADLRLFGTYDINGLGNRLDGPDPTTNAFRSLSSNQFNNWTVGLLLDVPLGFRDAHAQIRRAELRLAQGQAVLRDLEGQAVFALQASYRRLVETSERLQIQSALRQAATTQYRARLEEFRRGVSTIPFLLEAQREWVAAQRLERQGVFEYNIALADFERQKGTILQSNNVTILEGPLPSFVKAHASENIRQREQALLLKTRSVHDWDEHVPGVVVGPPSGWAKSELMDESGPPSLPHVLDEGLTPGARREQAPLPKPLEERIPAPQPSPEKPQPAPPLGMRPAPGTRSLPAVTPAR